MYSDIVLCAYGSYSAVVNESALCIDAYGCGYTTRVIEADLSLTEHEAVGILQYSDYVGL